MAKPKLSDQSEAFMLAMLKLEKHLQSHECGLCFARYEEIMKKLTACAWWAALNRSEEPVYSVEDEWK